MIDTSFTMNQEQVSQELQLEHQRVRRTPQVGSGGYYFTEEGDLLDTVVFGGGLLQVYGPNDFKNDAWAAFTHNNFGVTDRLGLTLGLRYTEETKYFTGGQSDLNDSSNRYLGVPAVPVRRSSDTDDPVPARPQQARVQQYLRALGAEYKITPDVMTYLSYAQGYKSGGWTTRLAVPLTLSAGAGAPIDPDAAAGVRSGKSQYL